MPHDSLIDPTEMPKILLPDLIKIQHQLGPPVILTYRLLGSRVRSAWQKNPTGKTFEEVHSKTYFNFLMKHTDVINEALAPSYAESWLFGKDETFKCTRQVVVPFFGDDLKVVSCVLCFVDIRFEEQINVSHPVIVENDLLHHTVPEPIRH